MGKSSTKVSGIDGSRKARTYGHAPIKQNREGGQKRTVGRLRYMHYIVTLFVAIFLASGIVASVAVGSASSPAYAIGTVPTAAYNVYYYAKGHNWSPPPNYKGGSRFYNRDGKLPNGHGYYKRYYIYPSPTTSPRRIVINTQTKDAWYTPNHYESFVKFMDY